MRLFTRPLSVLLVSAVVLVGGKFDGPSNAPIKIDLFSDFQCPHCRELHMGTLQLLKADYVKTGKVYLTNRDIALPQHQYSRTAALYALAAQQIGRYDEVADILFARQNEWSLSGKVDATIAGKLTPSDMTKVRALTSDPKVLAAFDADMATAVKKNLGQTPTLLIMHKLREYPVTDLDYTFMKQFIAQLLTK